MLDNILPSRFASALDSINKNSLTELRLRVNQPAIVFTNDKYYLSEAGLTSNVQKAMIPRSNELADIVFNASGHSIYAHNDELIQGFLTIDKGLRLGIAGQLVMDKDNIKTLKNYTSINLRFAREVKNCSLNALPYILDDTRQVCNTLIFSPPNGGKTTFIRDLCYQFSAQGLLENTLLIDERNEISATTNGIAGLNVGQNTDVYVGCTKQFGIINGIRTMAPTVIVLDEISTLADINALDYAFCSGVRVIATTHSQDFYSLQNKPLFKNCIKDKMFDRYIMLRRRNGECIVDSIYNNAGVCLYSGR